MHVVGGADLGALEASAGGKGTEYAVLCNANHEQVPISAMFFFNVDGDRQHQ